MLKHDLLQSGEVVSVTKAGSPMTYFPVSFSIKVPGKKTGESLEMATTVVSPGYFQTVGTKLKSATIMRKMKPGLLKCHYQWGRRETAMVKRAIEPTDHLDIEKCNTHHWRGGKDAYRDRRFIQPSPPFLYVIHPAPKAPLCTVWIPIRTQQLLKRPTLYSINTILLSLSIIAFADESYSQTFQSGELIGTLAGIFAGLAVFISCLGLFGLAAYMAEQRKKK